MLTTRIATNHDIKKLASIYKEAYDSANIGETWTDEAAEEMLTHFYKLQPDLFFVAEFDSEMVGGIVALFKPWWDGNHLTDGELFVDPSVQGKGIDSVLIKTLFEEGQKKYNVVSWDTYTHRVHEYPLKWYKKIGFEEIEDWTMISGEVEKVLGEITKPPTINQ